MPLYNKEKEVARSIRSVLAQSVKNIEVIIVNDGSTDNGREIVGSFNNRSIRLIDQVNSGVSQARNRGIDAACSDLIAFLDADDEWFPDFLETILRLRAKFPKCKVYATRYIICYPNGTARSAISRGLADDFSEGVLQDYFIVASNSDPPLFSSAIAVCKNAITAIGGFPYGINEGEDLLTWARLAGSFDIAYSFSPLVRFYAPQYDMTDRPPRPPQIPDLVSTGLKNVAENASPERLKGFNEYLALWHRMRSVAFIKSNKIAETRDEIRKSVEYGGISARLLILWLLCCLPGKMPFRLHNAIYEFLQIRRSNSEKLS
jgi:glycosyltransferase involved in cell wall biosynthesis